MKNNGKLSADFKRKSWCYEHAIAVYALAEAYTLCVKSFGENINQLEDAVQASGQFLINSQNVNGAWAYSYVEEGGHTDTSIVGWQLQALKACKFTGLDFKNMKRCVKNALDYMETKQASSGAFGYSSTTLRHDGTTLSAVGALSFQIWESSTNRHARKAVRFMDKNMKFDTTASSLELARRTKKLPSSFLETTQASRRKKNRIPKGVRFFTDSPPSSSPLLALASHQPERI